jgi:hypothetical protein
VKLPNEVYPHYTCAFIIRPVGLVSFTKMSRVCGALATHHYSLEQREVIHQMTGENLVETLYGKSFFNMLAHACDEHQYTREDFDDGYTITIIQKLTLEECLVWEVMIS